MAISEDRSAAEPDTSSDVSGVELSLVRDDLAFRFQRKLGLIPAKGMGTARRAIIFAAITWLPLVIWAVATGRGNSIDGADTLFGHFGIHVRCLVAIPLFIFAEDVAQKSVPPLLRYFVQSGLVPTEKIPLFRALIASVIKLRNGVLPWVLIIGAVIAWSSAGAVFRQFEDISWATAGGEGSAEMTFGGWWFVLVIRPIFTALLLAWLWRACLVCVLTFRLARFPLALVPTHPDRVGGLGFFERIMFVFSPVAFAVSAVTAASFAHEVVYHDVQVMAIKGALVASTVLVTIVFLLPMVPLALVLGSTRRKAMMDYGSLVGHHGRLVHRRWVQGEEIGSPAILDAAELGPVADVQTIYAAVQNMRSFPIGKRGIVAIAVPAVLPMLFVAGMQLPMQGLVLKVLKTLI
ncbi:hypothetical protein ABH945_004555 [Paraburkholderia sp. GAS333]|uniref:hypothetical protein n=1 Tax=Paraburkholderia sp. GAS333 TaxID=3156279 RepID=UPI003D236151